MLMAVYPDNAYAIATIHNDGDLGDPAQVRLIQGVASAVAMLSLVLYPYVYMLARVAFLGQGQSAFEAARVLGIDRVALYRKLKKYRGVARSQD